MVGQVLLQSVKYVRINWVHQLEDGPIREDLSICQYWLSRLRQQEFWNDSLQICTWAHTWQAVTVLLSCDVRPSVGVTVFFVFILLSCSLCSSPLFHSPGSSFISSPSLIFLPLPFLSSHSVFWFPCLCPCLLSPSLYFCSVFFLRTFYLTSLSLSIFEWHIGVKRCSQLARQSSLTMWLSSSENERRKERQTKKERWGRKVKGRLTKQAEEKQKAHEKGKI